VLDRVIDATAAIVRRRVRRGSRTWNLLTKIWTAWRFCVIAYRKNPLIQRVWARHEAEFERALAELSERTEHFFVIQIGACDGLMADPIHAWIMKPNWHGILVEPQKVEFDRLNATYREQRHRLILENVAIAGHDGTCQLYRVRDEARTADWERGLASLLPQPDTARFSAETVPCISFDTLLDRHGVSRLDLLQIDVEGYDFEILKLLDFRRLRPALIRYEHRHLKPREKASCRAYLARRGYRLLEMEFDTGAVLQRVPS